MNGAMPATVEKLFHAFHTEFVCRASSHEGLAGTECSQTAIGLVWSVLSGGQFVDENVRATVSPERRRAGASFSNRCEASERGH